MDAEDVVEADVHAALNVPALTSQVALFQHVPADYKLEDPGAGLLIIGDMDSEPIVTKDGRDETVSLVLAAVIVAEERRPIRALKATVLDLLHNRLSDRDGWRLHYTFSGSEGFLDPETGQAYVGNFRFTVIALRG
jgi:hypothetical protein